MRVYLFALSLACVAIPPAYGTWWLEITTEHPAYSITIQNPVSNAGMAFANRQECIDYGIAKARRELPHSTSYVSCSETPPRAFDHTPPEWIGDRQTPKIAGEPHGKDKGDGSAHQIPEWLLAR